MAIFQHHVYYAPQHQSVLESKKNPFEKVLFGLSVDYVCEAIFIKSTLVWWYMCSESGDKCEVWADCSQVNGEFWTNWRIGGRGGHLVTQNNISQ